MKNKLKNSKGITLVALVVTIVVLLILAGVSINLVVGQNGIINKAKDAKKNYTDASEDEKKKLENTDKWIDEQIGGTINPEGQVKPGVEVTGSNKQYVSNGKTAIIPVGFKVSEVPEEQNIDTGLVIKDVKNGNEFVWIPVASEEEYVRNFSYPSRYNSNLPHTPEGSTFTDTGYLPEGIKPVTDDATNNEQAERNAVLKHHGFYVGRYEATGTQATPTCKGKQAVLVNISQADCKTVAQKMYNDANKASAMCSGIQWDMVMKFIDGKNDGTVNSVYDVRTEKAERHRSSGVEVAGKNKADKVQNIYDLEGNCYEYVSEKQNVDTSSPFVLRGGYYDYARPASLRSYRDGYANTHLTFRPVLYVK